MKFSLSKHGRYYCPGDEIPLPERPSLADRHACASLEQGKTRVLVAMSGFFLMFSVIGYRLVDVSLRGGRVEPVKIEKAEAQTDPSINRADIVDRNGIVLASSLPFADLHVDASKIKDPEAVAAALAETLPDLNYKVLLKKLKSKRNFVYIKRNLIPREQYEVNRLGIHELEFESTERRLYPQGALASHILGATDVDGKGIAGVEKAFNSKLTAQKEPLRLSLDSGVQSTVRNILTEGMTHYGATGASAVLLNAKTGEIVSLVSLPDFDPNNLNKARTSDMFNSATVGVYELGSVMKMFNTAIALDLKKVKITDKIDAGKPIVLAGFSITEPEEKNRRPLSVPEIMIHSSNVGSARLALDIGPEKQEEYLRRFGLLSMPNVELPERGRPILPNRWSDMSTAYIGFGYSLSVSPLQAAAAAAAVVNGGVYHAPRLTPVAPGEEIIGRRVISKKTSETMRAIMRMVVLEGSGRRANVPGYEVGGKTGSARKTVNGQYVEGEVRTSFLSAFPMDNPQYVLMVMLDSPKKIKETYNLNNAAWNVVPTANKIISAVAPQLGIAPRPYEYKQAAPYVKTALNAQ